ncbi:trk system potassium uptake protein TrkH [Breoghania corrubedonensis]|uniref:Trk system potassium uptake protein TrkH n=1 Tax=Breoghania corrubedonensis TaxID=665038 RepID=A0A2T5V914_9HYPH|nr:potassium transporter TrkG [Breoghania corrubedonensis]PTW60249.1 trk system potassium uptake protein TrkH [Breoghania corrubedonensis]
MTGTLYFLSMLLIGFSGSMVLPAAVATAAGDRNSAIDFLMIAALVAFVAAGTFVALRGRRKRFDRVQSYVLLVTAWVVLSAVGAVPFLTIGAMSPGNAIFEAVSGLTTTGGTVLINLDKVPFALIVWRAELQWLGGLLTLLGLTLISAPAGIGGLPDRHIRLVGIEGYRDRQRLTAAVRDISGFYVAVTLACIVLLLISGIPTLDAVCLAFSTVSTGGFVPVSGMVSSYANPMAEVVLMTFMLIGATSLLWQRMVLLGRMQMLKQHRESYSVIILACVMGLVYAAVLFRAAGSASVLSPLQALREGMFTAISLVTTTGFEVREAGFAVLPLTLILFVALVGGGTFSTAGGLKHYRVGGMAVQAYRELGRLVYPHAIRPAHFGSQAYDIQLMKAIWSFFVAAIFIVALGSLALALENMNYEGALIASIASFSNIGTLYSSGWLPIDAPRWPGYADFNGPTKLILCALMILGRIEVLALFGALNRTYWLRR